MHPASPLRRLAAATLLALAGATAQAAIVEGADVGGFRTFVDTQTGTVWADLDNHLTLGPTGFGFRFADYAEFQGALAAAGFTWAFSGEVAALMASVALTTTGEYDGLGQAMGSLSFGETSTISGYSNATDGLVRRQYGEASYATGTAGWAVSGLSTRPVALNDSGLWAYLATPGGGASVPLPGTLGLAGLAGLALVAQRRSRA